MSGLFETVLLVGLLGTVVLLIPSIMVMKIKYFKMLNHKKYGGLIELFSFLSREWWIAGFTLGLPIIGKDNDVVLDQVRQKANSRTYILYSIVITLSIGALFLNKL